MTRARELANFADNTSGLESLTVADITDLTATATELNYTDGVGSALQTQIDAKAPKASPAFTGTVTGITKTHVGLGNVDNTSDATKQTATLNAVTATHVGLENVDNTSDATKQTAFLNAVTASHVGLGNVTNESKATMFNNPTFTGTVTGVDAGDPYEAGNTLIYADDHEYYKTDTSGSASLKLMRQYIAKKSGDLRLKFDAYIQSGQKYWRWEIHKNGSSYLSGYYGTNLDTSHNSSASVHSYTRFVRDIVVNAGDRIQFFMQSSNSGGGVDTPVGQQLYVKNFRVYALDLNVESVNNVKENWFITHNGRLGTTLRRPSPFGNGILGGFGDQGFMGNSSDINQNFVEVVHQGHISLTTSNVQLFRIAPSGHGGAWFDVTFGIRDVCCHSASGSRYIGTCTGSSAYSGGGIKANWTHGSGYPVVSSVNGSSAGANVRTNNSYGAFWYNIHIIQGQGGSTLSFGSDI